MPEEEEDDDKKGGKDKKAGKNDKKGGKDDKKGGKDDKKGKEKSPKSPGKGSAKDSPKAEKKGDASKEKVEKSEKSEPSEKIEEPKAKSIEKVVVKKPMGPYRAPPPSDTMLKAMAETGPVYAERFFNDSYEDEQGGRNYVEVQRYERRSGTNINEGAAGAPRGGQALYVDVPPSRPSRSPAFDEHNDRRRSRRDHIARPSMSQEQVMCFDDGGNMALRQEASFCEYQDVPPAGPVPHEETRRPIVLPPTTIVVNLTEDGQPSVGDGGSSALVGARSSGYDMPRRQLSRRASMRSHEELRTPQRRQQSDLHVSKRPLMTAQMTQQMRDIAKQKQRQMDDNVPCSRERVLYEVTRKTESSESSERSELLIERFQRPRQRPSGPVSGAMTPMSAPRLMAPVGMMSSGVRPHPHSMMRSPMGRGYLPRVPSGPMRVASPRMPIQCTQRWGTSSVRSSPLSPARNRDEDGMVPERSLIMLLLFLFVLAVVVVFLALSGMSIPGFGKNRNS